MNNKKRNTIITLSLLGIILFIGGIIFFLNYTSHDNNYSILEKKWITDHANQMLDVDVYNDVPIYGYNGNGINFSFLDYFTNTYQINFNKISYYTTSNPKESDISFQILDTNAKIKDNDLLLYQDHYVILKKDGNTHVSLSDIEKLGCLNSDSKVIEGYFNNMEVISYEDIDALINAILNNEITYIVLPNLQFYYDILKNNLSIVYHISDLKNSFVLRVKDDTTYQVLKKGYLEYKSKEYQEDYKKFYLDIYFSATNTSDLLQKNYTAKSYKYGYVVNMPYENDVNGNFVGTLSNYIHQFEELTGVEIDLFRYDSIDEIKSALVSGEIDFAYANFDTTTLNMDSVLTNTVDDLNYVVLSKKEISVNSIKGFSNYEVSVILSSKLYEAAKENNLKLKLYPNTDDLIRSIDDNTIILMDKETYRYYKDDKLQSYKVVYEDVIKNGNSFIINSNNDPFAGLFNYYVSSTNYNDYRYTYNTDIMLTEDYTTIKVALFIMGLILFLLVTIWFINRKNVTNTLLSKEDKLKYIDPMTSLKNRSYLNMNIYNWDDNVIFPQSVVVFDVNNLKEVNDKLGREAGDEIIKKTASILINNQLENTDIIRSGGDEFLIYMVGYQEKEVVEYTKKILKEMKNIPNSLGTEVGYSMILDEVKTVDDAINEAILMMMKNKAKKR